MQHFSNAGFPCPIMQSPSDHFLRAINTDFDRIIAMCKNWQVLGLIVNLRLNGCSDFFFCFFFGWFWFFFGTCFSILFTFIHVHLWGLKPYITQSILVECFSLVFWNTLIVRRMELFDRMTMGIFHQWIWTQLLQYVLLKQLTNHQWMLQQLKVWLSNSLTRYDHY